MLLLEIPGAKFEHLKPQQMGKILDTIVMSSGDKTNTGNLQRPQQLFACSGSFSTPGRSWGRVAFQ